MNNQTDNELNIRSCLGSDSGSKVKSSTMDPAIMLLAVSIVSLVIVLVIVSFASGYYVAKARVRAARDQPIHLSKTETVYHVSRACSSLDGARTVKTLNFCTRCP